VIDRYLRLVQVVSVNRTGRLGVVLVTSSFVTFLVLLLARYVGILTNAYVGLITYLLFPSLFMIGLLLIPIGWYRYKKSTGLSLRDVLREKQAATFVEGGFFGSKIFQSVAGLTLLNVVFLGIVASQMLHFMEEAHFCGTACHSVMNPEWVTYQESPHARVQCVGCHVGEGAGAIIDSKLNGVWQIISVTFDLLERPIPTPVHNLRPSRETCEKCHWPDKFYGHRLKTIGRFKKDEESTPQYTTLSIKVDTGADGSSSGIHWHIAQENQVRYASVDDERKEIIWVEVRQGDGEFRRYNNRKASRKAGEATPRTLDCVDCHNRATHIYEDPRDAVDEHIYHGAIDRTLPFIKRESLAAITRNYSDEAAAMKGIANRIKGFYERDYPEIAASRGGDIDAAVALLQGTYRRNIHHQMNIDWNTYPSLIGHKVDTGCFRCHSPDLVDDEGIAISSDCTLCHSILAYDSPEPFSFMQDTDPSTPEYRMWEYLREEFTHSSHK
jgi:hypothetical protein